MSDPDPVKAAPPGAALTFPMQGDARHGRLGTPLLIVVLGGLLATLVVVYLVSRLEERTARADFTALAEQRLTLLDASIERALDSLVATGAFFDASPTVDRLHFTQLVVPILKRQPALKALEWVPYTTNAQLAETRQAVRAAGFPDFDIRELGPDGQLHPVGPRAEYFPVTYVEPLKGNERAFGFDLGSNPARFRALDTARREGRMVATARITLVQEQGREFGFLLLRPIYASQLLAATGPAPGSLLPDPAALRGYVLGVFRLEELIGSNTGGRSLPVEIMVFDTQGKPGETLLYPSDAKAGTVAELPQGVKLVHEVHVGGRIWNVVARPPAGILRIDRTATRILLVAGVLLTLMLALLQEQNRSQTRAIEETVALRTADLLSSERRLIQANHEAVQANRLKTMFLASMSHEFRTPMNAILGLLHVLGRTPLEPGQHDYVDKISSAARRLLRLIDDILDVSRIEAGKLSVEREPFMIEAVLRDVLVAVAPKLRDKPIELVLDLDPTTPGHLVGDGMRLTQVLVNLADNAAKFTQRGEITLSIGWSAQSEQRMYLRAAVRDTGPGLSPADARAVFKPFVQAEAARSRQHGGTGLGLAICRQLVNLMGGEIHVESRLGEGSNFHFEIPVGIASPAPVVVPRQGEHPPAVLVIDPHPASAVALARLVAAFDAPVRCTSDAATAGELLRSGDYGLVLVAETVAVEQLLPPGERVLSRIVTIAPTGTGLHGAATAVSLEKPLLPGLLAATLYAGERVPETSARTDPPEDAAAGQAALRRASTTPGTARKFDASLPAELRALAEPLAVLLSRGDPEAELAARALAERARGTPFAGAANELLRHASNFDFREASALLGMLWTQKSSEET